MRGRERAVGPRPPPYLGFVIENRQSLSKFFQKPRNGCRRSWLHPATQTGKSTKRRPKVRNSRRKPTGEGAVLCTPMENTKAPCEKARRVQSLKERRAPCARQPARGRCSCRRSRRRGFPPALGCFSFFLR